jgi:hypothetical protein
MTSTLTQTQAYIQKEYGWMVGKTVASVRQLTAAEIEDMGWYEGGSEVPFVVLFTDGTWVVPMRDDEGNGAGTLAYAER